MLGEQPSLLSAGIFSEGLQTVILSSIWLFPTFLHAVVRTTGRMLCCFVVGATWLGSIFGFWAFDLVGRARSGLSWRARLGWPGIFFFGKILIGVTGSF